MFFNYDSNSEDGWRSKVIGFTCSTFDLLHAGHLLMLEECKMHCDHLIVGLQVDPTIDRPSKNKPCQSLVERYIQLRGCRYVDTILPYATEKDLVDLLTILPINVRFIGEDYIDKDFTGKELCGFRGIEIFYNTRGHSWSTTELRRRAGSIGNKAEKSQEISAKEETPRSPAEDTKGRRNAGKRSTSSPA